MPLYWSRRHRKGKVLPEGAQVSSPKQEPQLPKAPPELLRADEHASKEPGDSEWTLLASKDANWLEFHERIREGHVRVSALCPIDQLDALDKGVGRGGEFEELGRPGCFDNLFNHRVGDAVVEPLAFLGFVWNDRPLEVNLGFPAKLDLKGRRVSPDHEVWVDERLNRNVIEARYAQGERAVSTIRARTADLLRFLADRESALVIYDFHQILLRRFSEAESATFERADGELAPN